MLNNIVYIRVRGVYIFIGIFLQFAACNAELSPHLQPSYKVLAQFGSGQSEGTKWTTYILYNLIADREWERERKREK